MGKKKPAAPEDKMTLAEAFITFQIQVKRKEIEEFLSEVSQLEEKNQRYKKRKKQLTEEQTGHIRTLLKQAKEQERDLEQSEVVNREQVEQAQREYWELARTSDHQLEELRRELRGLEQKVLAGHSERRCWLAYKTVGSQEHGLQVQLLEGELRQLQRDFQEIAGLCLSVHFPCGGAVPNNPLGECIYICFVFFSFFVCFADHIQRSLDVTVSEIDKKTEKLIDETKHFATETAIKHLGKHSRQEIRENEWLKKEITIYNREVALLENAVQKLEEENLAIVNEMFEHRLGNLKISRKVFLTEAAGLDVIDTGMLGEDFDKLYLTDQPDAPSRPIHFLLAAAEGGNGLGVPRELEGDERGASCSRPADQPTASPAQDLRVALYGSQVNFQEPMQLGPLELKLLSVVGQAMPIHQAQSSPRQDCGPRTGRETEDWPVTSNMIQSRFGEPAPS
ncbi:coiled-coil domain-containing protein 83 [Amia ocellicauda]|uniref:coiled-coil domain-containing protein 83 n=1 Tax=Amia ocellicauda TaxID=2972642 RepID=UPI0034638A62